MVFPREEFLGNITELDKYGEGTITCNSSFMRDVGGSLHTALASAPAFWGIGNGIFWVENTTPSLPKFTNSQGTTITLGQNNITSVFGRTGSVVAANGDYNSDQVTNNSTVSGATVSDALDSLLSLSGIVPPLGDVLAVGNESDGYDIALTLSSKLITLDSVGVPETLTLEAGASTGGMTGGSISITSGDGYTSSGSISITSGDGYTSSGGVTIQSGGSANTTGSITIRSQYGGADTGDVLLESGGFGSDSTGSVVINTGKSNGNETGNIIINAGWPGGGPVIPKKGSVFLSAADASGSIVNGGDGYIVSGDANGVGYAGNVGLFAGTGGASGKGGDVVLRSGLGAALGRVLVQYGSTPNLGGIPIGGTNMAVFDPAVTNFDTAPVLSVLRKNGTGTALEYATISASGIPTATMQLIAVTGPTAIADTMNTHVRVTPPLGGATVTLPAGAVGKQITVKDVGGTALTDNITVTTSGTIDGSGSYTIAVNYGAATFVCASTVPDVWDVI